MAILFRVLISALLVWVPAALVAPDFARAEVPEATDAAAGTAVGAEDAPEPGASVTPAVVTKKSRNSRGKSSREKEIEGTEARNRFQADTVLKSKYQFNGEPLEVDPD